MNYFTDCGQNVTLRKNLRNFWLKQKYGKRRKLEKITRCHIKSWVNLHTSKTCWNKRNHNSNNKYDQNYAHLKHVSNRYFYVIASKTWIWKTISWYLAIHWKILNLFWTLTLKNIQHLKSTFFEFISMG